MLVLVRHGESAWNAAGRVAGGVDVALTARGRVQATELGLSLREAGIDLDVVHTSRLSRAINTAELMLDAYGWPLVPSMRTSSLNGRHYGALQGRTSREVQQGVGSDELSRLRREADRRPPLDESGRGEALVDVRNRLRAYVDTDLLPALDDGKTVLVVSHRSAIRMLVQLLEGLSDEAACDLDVPACTPRIYPSLNRLARLG